MAKTLTLNLNKGLIIEAVKADSYITGAIDKSADGVKNAALAYNEQAGDDKYHERKLQRTLAGAVGSFEANLAEFVDTSVLNGITDTLADAGDTGAFTITVIVSDRYNNGLAYPIAQLAQEYIVNKMLYYWWQSIRPALAKDYLAFSAESLTNIRLCLAKTAPTPADADYDEVTGRVDGGSGSSTETVVETITHDTDGWTVAAADLAEYYSDAGGKLLFGSTTNATFNVMNGTTRLFSISNGTRFTDAYIGKLAGVTTISFVPVDNTTDVSNTIFFISFT